MGRLRNRILPAESFTDGRLLSVSRDARGLALVLESLAEDTGVLADDPAAIRAAGGLYLGDGDSLASAAEITKGLDELANARWCLRYASDGMALLYLQGFGRRQQGPNVGIGVAKSSGEIASHLPLPPCVSIQRDEAWSKANRARPVHCERPHTACPCSELTTSQLEASSESGTSYLQQSGSRKPNPDAEPELESESEIEAGSQGEGEPGKGTPAIPAWATKMLKQQGVTLDGDERASKFAVALGKLPRSQGEEAIRSALRNANETGRTPDAAHLAFYAECFAEQS